jgi:hypothetical protein
MAARCEECPILDCLKQRDGDQTPIIESIVRVCGGRGALCEEPVKQDLSLSQPATVAPPGIFRTTPPFFCQDSPQVS